MRLRVARCSHERGELVAPSPHRPSRHRHSCSTTQSRGSCPVLLTNSIISFGGRRFCELDNLLLRNLISSPQISQVGRLSPRMLSGSADAAHYLAWRSSDSPHMVQIESPGTSNMMVPPDGHGSEAADPASQTTGAPMSRDGESPDPTRSLGHATRSKAFEGRTAG